VIAAHFSPHFVVANVVAGDAFCCFKSLFTSVNAAHFFSPLVVGRDVACDLLLML